jgi:hypothetical protein
VFGLHFNFLITPEMTALYVKYEGKLQRSATAPETIVAAVAAKVNWKNQCEYRALSARPVPTTKSPRPNREEPDPKAIEYPTSQ